METLLPLGEAWRRSGGEEGGELAEEALAAAAVAEFEMMEEEVESRRWKRTRLVRLLHLIVFPHPPESKPVSLSAGVAAQGAGTCSPPSWSSWWGAGAPSSPESWNIIVGNLANVAFCKNDFCFSFI